MFVYILTSLASSGLAQLTTKSEPKDASATVSTTYLPKYMLTNGFVIYDSPVMQTDVNIQFPKLGLWIDLWNSNSIHGAHRTLGFSNANFGDEVDYSVGWSGSIHGYDVTTGVAYYDLFPITEMKGDIIQPFMEVDRTFVVSKENSLTPYARFEFPLVTKGTPFEGGTYIHLGVRHSFNPALLPTLHFNHGFEILYDDGVAGFDTGFLIRYKAEATIDVTRHVSVFANGVLMSPLGDLKDARKLELVPAVGVKVHIEF